MSFKSNDKNRKASKRDISPSGNNQKKYYSDSSDDEKEVHFLEVDNAEIVLRELDISYFEKEDASVLKIYTEDKFQNNDTCPICLKIFKTQKERKICKFCAQLVCKDHLKKVHQHPHNENIFEKICESCDYKFLSNLIHEEFKKKLTDKKLKISELENELKELELRIQKKSQHIMQTNLEKNSLNGDYSENALSLGEHIGKMDTEIKEIEAELLRRHEQFDEISTVNNKWEAEINDMEKEIVTLKEESERHSNNIKYIDQDNKTKSTLIQEIEQILTQKKIDKKSMADLKTKTKSFVENYYEDRYLEGSKIIDLDPEIKEMRLKQKEKLIKDVDSCCNVF